MIKLFLLFTTLSIPSLGMDKREIIILNDLPIKEKLNNISFNNVVDFVNNKIFTLNGETTPASAQLSYDFLLQKQNLQEDSFVFTIVSARLLLDKNFIPSGLDKEVFIESLHRRLEDFYSFNKDKNSRYKAGVLLARIYYRYLSNSKKAYEILISLKSDNKSHLLDLADLLINYEDIAPNLSEEERLKAANKYLEQIKVKPARKRKTQNELRKYVNNDDRRKNLSNSYNNVALIKIGDTNGIAPRDKKEELQKEIKYIQNEKEEKIKQSKKRKAEESLSKRKKLAKPGKGENLIAIDITEKPNNEDSLTELHNEEESNIYCYYSHYRINHMQYKPETLEKHYDDIIKRARKIENRYLKALGKIAIAQMPSINLQKRMQYFQAAMNDGINLRNIYIISSSCVGFINIPQIDLQEKIKFYNGLSKYIPQSDIRFKCQAWIALANNSKNNEAINYAQRVLNLIKETPLDDEPREYNRFRYQAWIIKANASTKEEAKNYAQQVLNLTKETPQDDEPKEYNKFRCQAWIIKANASTKEEAINYAQQVLNLIKEIPQDNEPKECNKIRCQAWIIKANASRNNEAISYAQQVLILTKETPQDNEPKEYNKFRCQAWIALANSSRDNEAFENYRKSYEISYENKLYDLTYRCLIGINNIYASKSCFDIFKAFGAASDALDIAEKYLGDDQKKAEALFRIGKSRLAGDSISYYKRALELCKYEDELYRKIQDRINGAKKYTERLN